MASLIARWLRLRKSSGGIPVRSLAASVGVWCAM